MEEVVPHCRAVVACGSQAHFPDGRSDAFVISCGEIQDKLKTVCAALALTHKSRRGNCTAFYDKATAYETLKTISSVPANLVNNGTPSSEAPCCIPFLVNRMQRHFFF